MGGNGIAAKIIYDEVKPNIDPLSPDNKLVFMTGPVNGTRVPFASKFGAWFLSPLTNHFHDSLVSGPMSAEIKFAGYDGFVFEGRSDKPVYLWVDDADVQIKDASNLWGKIISETQETIREEIGDHQVPTVCIGPGGENLVKYASAAQDIHRELGRGGVGAVMGSKNLKAVAVRGSGTVEVADVDGLQKFADMIYENEFWHKQPNPLYGTAGHLLRGSPHSHHNLGVSLGFRNFQEEWNQEMVEGLNGELWREKYIIKDLGCYNCSGCSHTSLIREGPYAGLVVEGPEFETFYSFGSMVGNSRMDVVLKANDLCDEYGLDSISAGLSISFAMECYEKGLITRKDMDGLDLKWGNSEAILEMIEKIAKREGFGNLLAEGSWRAAKKIGKGSEYYSMTVKGLEMAGHSPRTLRGVGLGYATSTCGGRHHDYRHTPEYGGVDYRGVTCSPRLSVDGKPQFVADENHRTAIEDSLVLCRFHERTYGFTASERHVEFINLVTGFGLDLAELTQIGERIYNLERSFNVRCGIRRRTGDRFLDDTLPERMLTEKLTVGPAKGDGSSKEILDKMLDDYYDYRGWDKKTGIPTSRKLIQLGLEDVDKDLNKLR